MNLKPTIRVAGILLFAAILMIFLCTPIGAENVNKEEGICLCLRAKDDGKEGLFEVTIDLSSARGICAMLCDLEYNPDNLVFLSGGSSNEKINLELVDFGGILRLLLDSSENSPPECRLVTLYFKRIANGGDDLDLTCREALSIDEGAEILTVGVAVFNDLPSNEQGNTDAPEPPPRITYAAVCDGTVLFTVNVGEDFFAAGVRLFFVDLDGEGEHFEITVAGVVGRDGVLRGEYRFSTIKSYAIALTALGYRGNRTVRGERCTAICHKQN